jgi:hypothetical protein
MIRRIVLVLFLLTALIAAGCAGGLVRHDALERTGKLALVSVAAKRVADGKRDANDQVLQDAVEHAADKVRSGLAGVRKWKVVSATDLREGKMALGSFGSVNRAELAAVFPQPQDQDRAREVAAAELAGWKERFLGAKGLAVVPREALLPDDEETQKDAALRPLMLQQAGKLAQGLGMDAVAFVQVRYSITHPRESAFIVTDDRTDGLLGLTVTLTIVNREGTVIVDMGLRPVNESARSRDLLPLYRGAGRDAVKPEHLDLADPKKKVARAIATLIDESVADLMTELKAALAK